MFGAARSQDALGYVETPPPRRLSRPRKRLFITLGICLFIVLAVLGGSAWLFLGGSHLSIPVPGGGGSAGFNSPGAPGDKVLLVMGVDVSYDMATGKPGPDPFKGSRTDSMMLVRINPALKSISMVSIPRDSKVYIANEMGIDKINAAFALGGSDLTVRTVKETFGIPVDNFIVIDPRGVRQMVDALGGVTVYVEKPMKYDDNTAKLHINFTRGYHEMDGKMAEGFVRFRHDALGDIGRIRRQQRFLSAIAQKLKDPWTITRIPSLVETGSRYVLTDLSMNEMMQLAWFAKDLDWKNVRVATLPGRPSGGGISYWLVDPPAAEQVLDRLILDNPMAAERSVDQIRPLRVGIFYTANQETKVTAMETAMSKMGFEVVCKLKKNNTATQLIEHTTLVTDRSTYKLRGAYPGLDQARIIYAPIGTTYESNACSGSEDYTLQLGDDFQATRG